MASKIRNKKPPETLQNDILNILQLKARPMLIGELARETNQHLDLIEELLNAMEDKKLIKRLTKEETERAGYHSICVLYWL